MIDGIALHAFDHIDLTRHDDFQNVLMVTIKTLAFPASVTGGWRSS